jgi:hypothetical protein
VTRRFLLIPLTAALIAGGCSTFSGSDDVARISDAELSRSELDDIVAILRPDAPEGDAQTARDTIGFWLLIEAVRVRFEADGIEVTDADRDLATNQLSDPDALPGFTELDDEMRDLFVDWQSVLNILSQLPPEYRDEALAEADAHVNPRFGTLQVPGSVIPLALPTQQAT